jgi:hypothetical protein
MITMAPAHDPGAEPLLAVDDLQVQFRVRGQSTLPWERRSAWSASPAAASRR